MGRLGGDLPERRTDPLWRVRDYVDRRTGGLNEARERRRQRALARQPVLDPGAAIQQAAAVPANGAGLDRGRLYRQPYGGGSPERLGTPALDSSGTQGYQQIAYLSDTGICRTASTTFDPGAIAAGDDDGTVVNIADVKNDGNWVCAASHTQIGQTSNGNGQWLISASPWVTDGQVSVRIFNASGNSQNLPSGTLKVRCCT